MTGRRIAIATFLVVGVGALVMAYLQSRERALAPSIVTLEVVESHPLVGDLVEGASRLPFPGDPPRAQVPEEAPLGRLYHVAPTGDDDAPGTRDQPWRDLERAACRLEPGDRLFVLPGRYRGPVAIASGCRDGTAERPIEVFVSDDATLVPGDDPTEPPLMVARAHWRIEGLEVAGSTMAAPAIRFEAGARHVALVAAHVFDGAGDGIHVGPGSERIEIRNSHLHHLGAGHLAGGVGGRSAEPRAAAISIFPGTHGIHVVDCRVHNVDGEPVRVVSPEEHRAIAGQLLAGATDVIVDSEEFQTGQEPW